MCALTRLCATSSGLGGGGSTADCMWTDKLKSSLEKLNFSFFSSSFFTIDFKICLYAWCFDTSHCPHDIFWLHFANSSKLWESKMCQWTSFKFSAIKLFSQSFGELMSFCSVYFDLAELIFLKNSIDVNFLKRVRIYFKSILNCSLLPTFDTNWKFHKLPLCG